MNRPIPRILVSFILLTFVALFLLRCGERSKELQRTKASSDTTQLDPAYEKLKRELKLDSIRKSKEPKKKSEEASTVSESKIVFNSSYDGSVRQVEKYLENKLKDPTSYEGIEWGKVIRQGSGFLVRHKYRAKNSFGGYTVENKLFYLTSTGEVKDAVDFN